VTRGQFAAFVGDTGYRTQGEKAGFAKTWINPGFSSKYDQTANDPVVAVSAIDAKAFCNWLTERERETYNLPTEAEWEYACRAGTTSAYFFGDDQKALGDYAWPMGDHTHPVGLKRPNPWGLFDLFGNVPQWSADRLDNRSPYHVLRGGIFRTDERGSLLLLDAALVGFDANFDPNDTNYRVRWGAGVGFRVVMRVPAKNL
jgi:formylglycine-generating enzyme required for sulfatase activity